MYDVARRSRPPRTRIGSAARALAAWVLGVPGLGSRVLGPISSLAYRWYSGHLLGQVRVLPVPGHIAMILDGNRRFARHAGFQDPSDGYRYGASKVREVIGWCDQLSIPVVTLWGLSTDNLSRSPTELDKIFQSVGDQLESLGREAAKGLVRRRIRAVGRLELLSDRLKHQIEEAERATSSFGPHVLNVAVAYGGRDEILDAVKRLLRDRGASNESAEEISEGLSSEDLQPYMYAPDMPEPDLIIRTSGEVRLSGFLLWQSVYSELYFCDVPWPAFRKIDFLRAIRSFQARQRRHGR